MAQQAVTWHREDIKGALRKRFGTLRLACLKWGYDRTAISHVLADARFSRPLELKIASALGVKPHVVWPDRWAADGSPAPRDGVHSGITTKSRKSCQKAKAA